MARNHQINNVPVSYYLTCFASFTAAFDFVKVETLFHSYTCMQIKIPSYDELKISIYSNESTALDVPHNIWLCGYTEKKQISIA